jgi:hypothetical protein
MQRIYEPENLMEGELLQQMLASEGIDAHLVGRHLLGGTGELPIWACWAWKWRTTRPVKPAS